MKQVFEYKLKRILSFLIFALLIGGTLLRITALAKEVPPAFMNAGKASHTHTAITSGTQTNARPSAEVPGRTEQQKTHEIPSFSPESGQTPPPAETDAGIPAETSAATPAPTAAPTALPTAAPTATPTPTPAPAPTPTPAPRYGLDYDKINRLNAARTSYYVIDDVVPARLSAQYETIIKKYGGILLGSADEKKLYLTFNMGDECGYTEDTLAILAKKNVKATFFFLGSYIKKNPELVKQIYEQGHLIANHGAEHIVMPEVHAVYAAENIMEFENILKEYTGIDMEIKYFRPPSGYFSERDLEITRQCKKTSVFWGYTYRDYFRDDPQFSSDEVYHFLYDNIRNGQVYQLHLVNRANNLVLERFIDAAEAQGYSFGLISEIA